MSESNTNKTQAESSKLKTCLTACGNSVKKHKSLTALTLSVLLGLGLALTIGRKPLGEKLGFYGTVAPASSVLVEQARIAPAPAGANGAVYLTLSNPSQEPDYLLGASSPVVELADLHQTRLEGEVMVMSPVSRLEIPAQGQLRLEPAGYHLMLNQLKRPLVVGDTFEVTLLLEKAGNLTVNVPVSLDSVPGAEPTAGHDH